MKCAYWNHRIAGCFQKSGPKCCRNLCAFYCTTVDVSVSNASIRKFKINYVWLIPYHYGFVATLGEVLYLPHEKSKAHFPQRSLFGLWNSSRRAGSPPLLETEQTARVAVRCKPVLAYGTHRFGVTWSALRGKASTRRWIAGLTAVLLIFPAAAVVCGLGFEVTAFYRSAFRWEHRSASWALWGGEGRGKNISDQVWLSEVKQLWLGVLWGKLSPSWDCDLEGDSECCLLIPPWVWAEVPAGKPHSGACSVSAAKYFLWGCFWLLPTRDIVLLRSLGTFGSQCGTPGSAGFQRCLPMSAHCMVERGS